MRASSRSAFASCELAQAFTIARLYLAVVLVFGGKMSAIDTTSLDQAATGEAAVQAAAPAASSSSSAAPAQVPYGTVFVAGSVAHSMAGRKEPPVAYDGVPETNLYNFHVLSTLKNVPVKAVFTGEFACVHSVRVINFDAVVNAVAFVLLFVRVLSWMEANSARHCNASLTARTSFPDASILLQARQPAITSH